jgi:DNA-binding CsgD family transcriptional regulator
MSKIMDWSAVTALLAERSGPVLLVDAELRVRLCSAEMEWLLGRDRDEIEGRYVDELCASQSDVADLLAGTGAGGERRRCAIVTAEPRRRELVVEVVPLAEGGTIFVVRQAHERTAPDESIDGRLEYEIRGSLHAFGRLVSVTLGDLVVRYWGDDAPRCHEALRARSAPCDDCPVIRGMCAPTVRRPVRPGSPYEVIDIEATPRLVRIRAAKVPRETLRAIHDLRLDELTSAVALSTPERAVLGHLLDGCELPEIARRLDMSIRTARLHETSLLGKLSAHSRAELLRLLL